MRKNLCCLFSTALLLAALAGTVGQTAQDAAAADNQKKPNLDADPRLVGWWKFDETSGKTADDASKHGRKGSLTGGLSFDDDSVPGRIGNALQLEGGEERIEITGYKGVSGTGPRTVTAWIKTKSSRGARIVNWGEDDFGKMFNFGFIRGRVGVTPNGGYLYINAEAHDDQWHLVAAVVEEAELPNLYDDVKLYMDGELQEIHDIGLLDLWPIDTGSDLDVTIGARFRGLIDDVRIYGRALSDVEMKALFEAAKKK